MLGLRYVASRVPVEQLDRTLTPGVMPLVARTPDAFIHENPRALPRVLTPQRAETASFEELLRTGAWPRGFDPRRTVLLETLPEPAPCPTATTAEPSARIVSYANNRVEIAVTSPAAASWCSTTPGSAGGPPR